MSRRGHWKEQAEEECSRSFWPGVETQAATGAVWPARQTAGCWTGPGLWRRCSAWPKRERWSPAMGPPGPRPESLTGRWAPAGTAFAGRYQEERHPLRRPDAGRLEKVRSPQRRTVAGAHCCPEAWASLSEPVTSFSLL